MKTAIVFVCVLACAFAAEEEVRGKYTPGKLESEASVLRSNDEWGTDGSHHSSYETSNGISADSEGSVKQFGPEIFGWLVRGQYKYTAPDGQIVETEYTADEDGFHPKGDHLPTPPPTQAIPENIARALAYIESHKPAEPTNPRA